MVNHCFDELASKKTKHAKQGEKCHKFCELRISERGAVTGGKGFVPSQRAGNFRVNFAANLAKQF